MRLEGQEGVAGVGCVGMGGVCGREREVRRQLTAWNLRTHTSNPSFFFLAWLVTFTELEKHLKCCLSFRHCRDHTFRQYFLPLCLLVVAVSLGTKTRLKQCRLVVLMNTVGTVLSILCISIVNWTSAHFGITCFCLLRLSLSETFPCDMRKTPMCVSLRLSESSPCFIRKAPMCVSLRFGLIRVKVF